MRKAFGILIILMLLMVGAAVAAKPTGTVVDPMVPPSSYPVASGGPQPSAPDNPAPIIMGERATAQALGFVYMLSGGNTVKFTNQAAGPYTSWAGQYAYAPVGDWMKAYATVPVPWNPSGYWSTTDWLVWIGNSDGADCYYTEFYDGYWYYGYDYTFAGSAGWNYAVYSNPTTSYEVYYGANPVLWIYGAGGTTSSNIIYIGATDISGVF